LFIIASAVANGWPTPTKAGALGTAVAFIVAAMKGTKLKTITKFLIETAKRTVMIVF
jgi:TRAP-type C4-dicarboxylate transport system permease large subunit